jgi:hypothetical protein
LKTDRRFSFFFLQFSFVSESNDFSPGALKAPQGNGFSISNATFRLQLIESDGGVIKIANTVGDIIWDIEDPDPSTTSTANIKM